MHGSNISPEGPPGRVALSVLFVLEVNMLSSSERTLVKLVAKISPWLAPLPSGYFVARAGKAHL
jgi:hypothetical protein